MSITNVYQRALCVPTIFVLERSRHSPRVDSHTCGARNSLNASAPSSGPRATQGDFYGYGFTAAYQRYQAGAGLIQELQVGLTVWLL